MISAKLIMVDVGNIELLNFSQNCFVNTIMKKLLGVKNMMNFTMKGTQHDCISVISATKRYGLMADMTRIFEKNKIRILRGLNMEYKYNINEIIESLNFTEYENKNAVKEILCFVVVTLTEQIKNSQKEMDYEDRISHNWSDYESSKAVRNFCQSFLNKLGVT